MKEELSIHDFSRESKIILFLENKKRFVSLVDEWLVIEKMEFIGEDKGVRTCFKERKRGRHRERKWRAVGTVVILKL